MNRPGFTLVELLAVLALMALLVGLLLPAVALARGQGRQAGCRSNLRQVGLAAQQYADRSGAYPPAWISAEARWMDRLAPYVDKTSDVYLCPADARKLAVAWDPTIFLSYGINTFRFADKDTCFWYGVKPQRVRRPSGVILFADCTPGKYYCGGGTAFADPVVDVDYRHPGKSFVAVYCDGHVEKKTTTGKADWDASP